MTRRAWRTALAAASAVFGSAALMSAGADATCPARSGAILQWIRAAPSAEFPAIDRWCAGVGPPARIAAVPGAELLSGRFVVVTWNTHVGGGQVERLVADLRAGRLTGGVPAPAFVLLLQEVYRAGADVPATREAGMTWASVEGPPASGRRADVLTSARRLGLSAIYVPSMRNGAPGRTDEDRGNAILSTVPLDSVTAIELPLERQRRVAIQATIRIRTAAGATVPLALVDTHFTNLVLHHIWLLSESGRLRQARALGAVLPATGALVVGGDFNSWFGEHDAAYRELAKYAAPAPDQDRRASFGPMRLDHLLFRLPAGWAATLQRANDRYGSDHYPLVATIDPR
jgi:endonuclease/exonuclease/phosphatase family metal-dependent hydrolase